MKVSLTASVLVLTKDRTSNSVVTIKMGSVTVAKSATMFGGKYTEAQALDELKRNPHRFKLIGPDAEIILASQGVKVAKQAA